MSSTCPTCRKPAAARAQNPSFPFCGPRCRAVDLGKWLGEEYRVASTQPELDEDGDMPRKTPDGEDLH
jgi:uncharacterized protein